MDKKKTPREKTIDVDNEVDEASFESFPASDPPGFAGGQPPLRADDESEKERDQRKKREEN